jgi:hypothetical protein
MEALWRTCARPPNPQAAWVHQIHADGGASGSNTMVMMFVMLFVLFVQFLTRDSLYILEALQSEPPRLAPYHLPQSKYNLIRNRSPTVANGGRKGIHH